MAPLWHLYGSFMTPLLHRHGAFMEPYLHQVVLGTALFKGAIKDTKAQKSTI